MRGASTLHVLADVRTMARVMMQVKKRVRLELLRWHEDKFAKFKDRLAASDVERILERVKAVAQTLNSISMKV